MITHPYPDEPGAKRTGTSTDAAVSMKSKAATLRDLVLETMRKSPLAKTGWTADEMAEFLNESVLSVRPRFSELLVQGVIRDSGQRRKNLSGRMATVWTAFAPGEQATLF